MDIAWAIAGQGARRWHPLQAADFGKDSGLMVRKSDVHACRQLRLDPTAPRASAAEILAQLDADVRAGWMIAGWIGYEVGAALERELPAQTDDWPDAAWLCFDPRAMHAFALADLTPPAEPPALPSSLLRQEGQFLASAADIADRIHAGEVYQVNLTVQADVPAPWLPSPRSGQRTR